MKVPKVNINKSVVFLVLAVILGIAASFLASNYIQQRISELAAANNTDQELVTVVVPRKNMESGEQATYSNMATRKVPATFVPAGAISATQFDAMVGSILVSPAKQGTPVTSSMLQRNYARFSDRLRKDSFAFTMSVDQVNSISGMIAPGDYVDLLFVTERNEVATVLPLTDNVLVLATGVRAQNEPGRKGMTMQYSNITMEVTPKQANKILLAKEAGEVRVLLHHPKANKSLKPQAMQEYALYDQNETNGVQVIIGGL